MAIVCIKCVLQAGQLHVHVLKVLGDHVACMSTDTVNIVVN